MRKEYDFNQGTRGKHAGKSLRIVGDPSPRKAGDTAAKIQQIIERDLKSRADFNVVWSELNRSERKNLRADWLKKINNVLTHPGGK